MEDEAGGGDYLLLGGGDVADVFAAGKCGQKVAREGIEENGISRVGVLGFGEKRGPQRNQRGDIRGRGEAVSQFLHCDILQAQAATKNVCSLNLDDNLFQIAWHKPPIGALRQQIQNVGHGISNKWP